MQSLSSAYDVAVIGSGFTGLAQAYWAARRGLKVAVFERHPTPRGHSMRQLGLIRPLLVSEPELERAIRGGHHWLQLADSIGFYAERKGALLLAHSELEMATIEEYAALVAGPGYRIQCLTPKETTARSPVVRPEELAGAMYSATEVCIDPRQALRALPAYLQEELGVDFYYRTAITEITAPYVYHGRRRWRAEQIVVCTGSATADLFPDLYPEGPPEYCKLQYLRTLPQPVGWRLGPNLLTGLSLLNYPSFAACPSLPLLRRYFTECLPGYLRWGIDLHISQTVLGEINIGESHETMSSPSPFDRREINELLLRYLHRAVRLPNPRIQETWHSIRPALSPGRAAVSQPQPGVTLIAGLGDTELAVCFGLAQDLVLADYQLPLRRLTA
jgi:FAD dependent oxidoreductase TIGR03364